MLDCDCERKKDRNWYVDTTRDPLADDISGMFNSFINLLKFSFLFFRFISM
jgi:hypothetical protein